ncbi:MAG: hypothetical protein MR782_07370, partial [Campylobacter sp.]|nr:hypothetical protein [Campylobacter sp.]
LGCSPYKICKLNLSRLKASKNLEFLEIALLPRNDENYRIPKPCVIHRPDRGGDLIIINLELAFLRL